MNFSNLALSQEMLANLDKLQYKSMTAIQAQALPSILEGKDVLAQAKTGSGKTAAFGIGVLSNLNVKQFRVQALVLCPTRELADQVAKELRNLAKFAHNIKILTLCGGVAFGPQLGSLRHNAHIIVGTPGRVLKHLRKESLSLENLNTLVLDEADRMLDMGFIEEIQDVLSFAPKQRQTLLFSATYPEEILELSSSIQKEALSIKTTEIEVQNKIVEQFYETEEKLATLITIFAKNNPKNAIVFCNTKLECDEVAASLQSLHVDALALHGDLEQYDRNDVLVQFSNASCRVLVATDVAARGLDIKELAMVVNYDLPHSQETYTHRIGRTARAGEEGIACTLYSSFELEKIQEYKNSSREFLHVEPDEHDKTFSMPSDFITLVIEGGKKDKLRKGDILGALTANQELTGESIGKIELYERQSYVAIKAKEIQKAYKKLSKERIKAKKFSVWILE